MDFLYALNQISPGIYSLLGVFVGFGLNFWMNCYYNRYRLCFLLKAVTMEAEWDYTRALKTEPSGFTVVIYNYGKNPVMISAGSIVRGNKSIDGLVPETVTVLPYQTCECILAKQDYGALREWVAEDRKLNIVDFVAITVEGKEFKGKLDITAIASHVARGINFV